MIYTKLANAAGPIRGYIATGRFASRRLNVFSYRKNALLPTLLGSQPTDSTDTAQALQWSSNASYLVVNTRQGTLASANSVKFFSRSGSTFTSQSVPSNFANTDGIACAIASDGSYVAAAGSYSTNYYGRIWHNAGGTLTNLTSVGSFSNSTRGCAVSSDGRYAAFLAFSSPLLRIKERSGSGNSATFADMTLAAQPASGGGFNSGGGLAFSPDDVYLAVSPFDQDDQTIYKFNAGTGVYEQLVSPFVGSLPDNAVLGCTFSAQGDFLAIATSSKTFFYERTGDTFTAVANVSSGNRGNFHPSGNFYITGSGQIYRKNSASSWTALGSALTAGNAAAFSPYV